jgi:uncharacterized protein
MRVLVSGSTGLIGSRLVRQLSAAGDAVVRLVRGPSPAPGETIEWSPEEGRIDMARLEGFDAIVHLAGESIASGRWSESRKKKIRDSRLVGTRNLAERVAKLTRPPKVVVSASAIGIYGDRGEELLDESSASGSGFLAEVCRGWENTAQPFAAAGARLVLLRTGIVLDRAGGALAKMRLPFSLGLGGRLGSGRQYMSWISLEDIVGAIRHALVTPSLQGPVNGVAPAPVTNAEFTRVLGRVMRRPTLFPVPQAAARLLLGEMADALLLASQRVSPARLLAAGYNFRHPELAPALKAALSSR